MSNLRKNDAKNETPSMIDLANEETRKTAGRVQESIASNPIDMDRIFRDRKFDVESAMRGVGGYVKSQNEFEPEASAHQQIYALWSEIESIRGIRDRNRELVLKALFWSRAVAIICVFQIVFKIIGWINQ